MTTSDWITLIAAILTGGGTLFLGIMAWRTIRQTRSIQKAEKRERLLNEIIDWATDIREHISEEDLTNELMKSQNPRNIIHIRSWLLIRMSGRLIILNKNGKSRILPISRTFKDSALEQHTIELINNLEKYFELIQNDIVELREASVDKQKGWGIALKARIDNKTEVLDPCIDAIIVEAMRIKTNF